MIYKQLCAFGAKAPCAAFLRREFTEMPTVIERISAAEADAEALRKNASEAARSAEAAAEDEAAASLKIAREEAKAGLALAAAMAEKEAGAEAARILERRRAEAAELLAKAEKNLPAAEELILDHIINKL